MELKLITCDEVFNDTRWLDFIDSMEKTIEEKLEEILPAIECPAEYLSLFDQVILLLERTLRERHKKYSINVYGFGSAVTGLCLKNCDLDLFVNFEPEDNVNRLLKIIKNTLYRALRGCFSRIIIIRAKVPIIRCVHDVGFECDISVGNTIALQNSKLIKFYISLNESFHLFFMCVKLWMKRHYLGNSSKFTSYATSMLCIFFLQQKQLVPSVFSLQDNSKSPPPQIINGWNVSFSSDRDSLGLQSDRLPIFPLLSDFFNFYATFEFGFYVISPYTGTSVLKPLSPNLIRCGSDCSSYDNSRYICLQDPFIHDFNPCRNVSLPKLCDFQTWFQQAHELCIKEVASPQKNFLKVLFSPYVYRAKKRQRIGFGNSIVLWVGRLFKYGDSLEESRDVWLKTELDILEKIFNNIVVATVKRQEGIFACEILHQTLTKKLRIEIANKSNIPQKMPNMQRDEAISSEIMKLEPSERDLKQPLSVTVNYSLITKPTRLQLDFVLNSQDPSSSRYFYDSFLTALHKYLASWVEEYLVAENSC